MSWKSVLEQIENAPNSPIVNACITAKFNNNAKCNDHPKCNKNQP